SSLPSRRFALPTPTRRHRRCAAVAHVATGHPTSHRRVQELHHHLLRRPRLSVGGRAAYCLAIARSSPPRPPHLSTSAMRPTVLAPPDHIYELRNTETDAAATQYDYGVDDPSLLPEQP
uniref:Uncharacterized protein n=1 Tax=Triticum urartu TaxID=4572 RepID=A0A8R7VBQ8_TRIUA